MQVLTQNNADLQKQVTALQQTAVQTQSVLRIDSLDTASSVSQTNNGPNWHEYVKQNSFASGYSGGFWVMFSFSNILHGKSVNIKADIYILSNGALKTVKDKPANLADTSWNQLWWGDTFDISAYPDGDYTVILTVTDVIAGTSAAQMTTFSIGNKS